MRLSIVILGLLASTALAADPKPPVIRSTKSGPWSDPTTWTGGKVPGDGARVLIASGHKVLFDLASKDVIRGISIAGTLEFARDRDTLLNVGVIKVQAMDEYSEDGFDCEEHMTPAHGAERPQLLVGLPNSPVAEGKSAIIRLHYLPGMNKETCPAIVCCGGRAEFHGQPMSRTWLKLGATATKGSRQVTLEEPVTGWHVGDQVILTATQTHGQAKTESLTETGIIERIEGKQVTLRESIKYDHQGEGDYRGEIANLSRNVIVESADPNGVRGHTMYHRHSAGSVTYSEFRHLGKKNVLGKYTLHFHLCRDTMRGSQVVGNSLWDSDNRWLTIHGTDFLIVRDNVGYRSVGHGYFLEDGTETYNLLDRNLAVGAMAGKKLPKQVLPFDQNEGAGFWWTCSLNSFTRNVAAECDRYGFRYEATPTSALKLEFPIRQADGSMKPTDPRTLPFIRFDDNEVHSSTGLYGVNLGEGVNRVGPDAQHPFVVRNLKIWDVHYGFRPQVPNLRVENLTLHKVSYGVYHPNFDGHFYRNVLISQTNTEPFNRGHDDLSVQYGKLVVDGLTFDGCRSGGMPLIQISDDNATGSATTWIRNLKVVNWKDGSRERAIINRGGGPRPEPKSEHGVPITVFDWFGPGRHAVVASTRSPEYKANADQYRAEPILTGDESRVSEKTSLAFPEPAALVDDLPPATVITRVRRDGSRIVVEGSTIDNGAIKSVLIQGTRVTPQGGDYRHWAATIDGGAGVTSLKVETIDESGNREVNPPVVKLP